MSESSQYVASDYNKTIQSKSTIVPSDHQLDYQGGQDQIKFEVPAYIGFIDPRQSYLKADISITAPVRARLNSHLGSQSVINNLRIWDGSSSVQLENLENYAERVRIINHYSENESIKNKRGMLEALEEDSERLNQYLFFDTYEEVTQNTVSTNKNKCQITMPVHSGILGGHKIFPIALAGGLRIEIDTNKALKVVESIVNGTAEKPCTNNDDLQGAAVNDLNLLAITSSKYQAVPLVSSCPFLVGQKLKISYALEAGGRGVAELGEVSEIVLNVLAVEIKLVDDFEVPTDAKKDTGGTETIAAGDAHIYVDEDWANVEEVSYKLSNVQLVLKKVEPPAAYIKSIMSKGSEFDIWTYDLVRYNLGSNELISQHQLPSYCSRAKAILTLPMEQGGDSLFKDNFKPVIDGMKRYNYYIKGKSQPNKEVDLSLLSSGYTEQLATWENQKALKSCGVPVRNIRDGKNNFIISRALSRYGGVSDLRGGDVQIKCEYNNPTMNKLVLNYICHLRRVRISKDGGIIIAK